jgi:hypothetical protein
MKRLREESISLFFVGRHFVKVIFLFCNKPGKENKDDVFE